MKLKRLDLNEVKIIYEEHLCNDFIPAEQKPWIVINILIRMGIYHCYGLYDEETFLGYAFLCEAKAKASRTILLDYLVIKRGFRGNGLGTTLLKLLKEELVAYDYIIGEVEREELAESKEEEFIRTKRKDFYLRNGWYPTKLTVNLFGEDLRIYVWPIQIQPEESELFHELNQVYDRMFYEKEVRQNVNLK